MGLADRITARGPVQVTAQDQGLGRIARRTPAPGVRHAVFEGLGVLEQAVHVRCELGLVGSVVGGTVQRRLACYEGTRVVQGRDPVRVNGRDDGRLVPVAVGPADLGPVPGLVRDQLVAEPAQARPLLGRAFPVVGVVEIGPDPFKDSWNSQNRQMDSGSSRLQSRWKRSLILARFSMLPASSGIRPPLPRDE